MTVLTDTQVVTASGGLVELGYSQITGTYTTTTTSAGNTTTFVGPVTIVSDGSPLEVEFFCPSAVNAAAGGSQVIVNLVVDGAVQGYLAANYSSFANTSQAIALSGHRRITLSAGSHTIGVSAWHGGAAGSLNAGSGSGTDWSPTFLRVSKIVQATQWPAVTTGTIICTSSTRPASPFAGQQIYETDTSKSLIYSGSVWQPPWNTAWGIVGVGTKSDGAAVPANTSFCSVTFTPVLNRYYSAFYTSRTVWSAAGTIGIYDSVAGGRIAEQYGTPDPVTLQRTKTFSTTASRTLSILTDGAQTPISGSYSGQERPAQLVVTDVGPA